MPTAHQLALVRAPALLLCGAQDLLVPVDSSTRLQALLPSAELQVLPQTAHQMMQEQPAAVHAVGRRRPPPPSWDAAAARRPAGLWGVRASGSGTCPPHGAGESAMRGGAEGRGQRGVACVLRGPTHLCPGLRRKCPSPSTPGQCRAGCFLLFVWAQQWVQQLGAPPPAPLLTNYIVLTPRGRQRSTGATGSLHNPLLQMDWW